MSIQENYVQMVEDEGKQAALDDLDKVRDALETCLETGNDVEKIAARTLMRAVRETIATITKE